MIVKDPLTLLFFCLSADLSEIQQESIKHLQPAQWQELLAIAHHHRVAPLLYYRLRQHDFLSLLPSAQQEDLQSAHQQNAVRNLQIMHELGQVLQLLQQQIDVILLKGVDLAATVYPYNALGYMADVDLLVHEKDLSTATELLKERQYVNSMLNTTLPSASDQHLAPLMTLRMPARIEIHWHIAPPQYTNALNLEHLWQNARHVTIADHSTFALSVTDLLLHICVHSTYQHRFHNMVRALCDVDAIVRHYQAEIAWERCIEDAYQRHWHKGTFVTLYLAKEWLATPVPDDVLAALRPSDFSQQVLTQVHRQITLPKEVQVRSDNVQRMLSHDGTFGKLTIFGQRVFLPEAKLKQLYPQAIGSLRYYYYALRLTHLLRRHTHTIWQRWFGNSGTKRAIKQQTDLFTWLVERV